MITYDNTDVYHMIVIFNDTPLHKASANGHTEIVKLLLEKNANIEAVDVVSILFYDNI